MNCFIASTSFLYYLVGYKIQLLFNNGETKVVDLSNSLNGKVFTPLKDMSGRIVQTLHQSIYMILHHKIATLAITH